MFAEKATPERIAANAIKPFTKTWLWVIQTATFSVCTVTLAARKRVSPVDLVVVMFARKATPGIIISAVLTLTSVTLRLERTLARGTPFASTPKDPISVTVSQMLYTILLLFQNFNFRVRQRLWLVHWRWAWCLHQVCKRPQTAEWSMREPKPETSFPCPCFPGPLRHLSRSHRCALYHLPSQHISCISNRLFGFSLHYYLWEVIGHRIGSLNRWVVAEGSA